MLCQFKSELREIFFKELGEQDTTIKIIVINIQIVLFKTYCYALMDTDVLLRRMILLHKL